MKATSALFAAASPHLTEDLFIAMWTFAHYAWSGGGAFTTLMYGMGWRQTLALLPAGIGATLCTLHTWFAGDLPANGAHW